MQREQLEQLLSANSMLRSTFLMLYLKEDNVEACSIVFFHLLHQQQKQSVHRFFLMESSHQGKNIYVNEMVKKAHFPVSGPL